jgi:uncharacterized protein
VPDTETAILAEARDHVGAPPVGVRVGRDPVNTAMINHWCDALEDRNPVYRDPDAAAATRHGGVIAPPAMLGTWTMDAAEAPRQVGPRDEVLRGLERAGYTAVVATNYEQIYHRQVRPGDHLAESISVEALSERKDTGLGPGYFVTVRHDYRDADGELVGTARMRLLKFRPAARPPAGDRSPAPARPTRPRPAINRDNAFFWEGVARGELRIQRCGGCGTLRHPPRPMCGGCRSTEWDTITAAGSGVVYSYAVHHHPPLPGIDLPHTVILVELEEGVRFVSSLLEAPADTDLIGLPVEVTFEAVEDDLVLPLFRVRGSR